MYGVCGRARPVSCSVAGAALRGSGQPWMCDSAKASRSLLSFSGDVAAYSANMASACGECASGHSNVGNCSLSLRSSAPGGTSWAVAARPHSRSSAAMLARSALKPNNAANSSLVRSSKSARDVRRGGCGGCGPVDCDGISAARHAPARSAILLSEM